MLELSKEQLKKAIKEVWIRSVTEMQPDILSALRHARDTETSERAKAYLAIMVENAETAAEKRTVICQDTGIPTFFIRTSLDFPYHDSFRGAFDEAMHELTMGEFPMRPSSSRSSSRSLPPPVRSTARCTTRPRSRPRRPLRSTA